MEKVVRIIDGPLPPEQRDVHYWLQQPPAARIAAVEEIRREFHGWKPGAEPRIEKVCRIVRLQDLAEVERLEKGKGDDQPSAADNLS